MRNPVWHFRRLMPGCLLLVMVFSWMMASLAFAADIAPGKEGFFHKVRVINTSELGIPNPAGLNFSAKTGNFLAVNTIPSDQALVSFTELMLVTMDEKSNGSIRIPVANLDPINSTFDQQMGGLLILDRSGESLVTVPAVAESNLQPAMLSYHNIKSWGLKKPMGMTANTAAGQIYILDASGPRLVKIVPTSREGLDNAYVTEVDLRQLGIVKPQGLAFDPANGHLHFFNQEDQKLYEITESGQIVVTRNLSNVNLTNPQALVFAPSFDQTDDPQQMSLYVADSGQTNESEDGTVKTGKNDDSGSIIELSLYEPVAMAESNFQLALNHTIDTSKLTPPSPDPCGVDYIPSSNNLLICDSEVEEMTNLWANANLFETTLSGTLVGTSNTIAFTKEPTGIAYNSANEHMFFSDDDGHRVFEVTPGPDKVYGTSDDVRTVFKTSDYDSNDPEGVAFDYKSNTLFIVDGVNEEVYLINPGLNGNFDGIAPYGDDQMTSFDTTILGVHDPEGIGFYPATGHLYITDTYSKTAVAEVTVAGTLVQIIDISAAPVVKPSGIGFGPSSMDAASIAMYVTDRGVDNNADPTENDGRVYEFSMPTSNSAPNVSINSPADETVYTEGDTITFSGSASDAEDGSLSESMEWNSSIDGAIGMGSAFTRSDLSAGIHTITASVTDSEGVSGSAGISITVNQANSAPTVSITSPADETVYAEGEAITFSGSASDAEDGSLSESMEWNSSIDGAIGAGSAFTRSDLSAGIHTITASVTDSEGVTNTANVTIKVNPLPQIRKFIPPEDAKVSSKNSKSNYGSSPTLELIKSTDSFRSYLKFNVTGLSGTIRTAKIRVYVVENSEDGGCAYAVSNNYKGTNDPWLESELIWKNAPSITGTPLSTVTAVEANTWVEFDVKAAINGDGEYSFALVNTSSNLTIYNSSEADENLPELVIETVPDL